jgi:ABC-type amino acid transport substrate-binding protein
MSVPSAKWFIKKNPDGNKFRVILDREKPFEENQDAIGVERGQLEWLNYLNLCLGILKKEGTFKKIFTEWFGDMEAAPQFFREPL